MASAYKLITSRRAYEFRMDDVRLSLLCLPQVWQQVQQAFGFQAGGLGTPPPTFGLVGATLPPGLVFNVGSWQEEPDGDPTPIRFIHVEQTRIVVDVAGPSSAIDPIFRALCAVVGDLAVSDGSPAIGEVARKLDYSEFSGQLPFDLDQLYAPGVLDVLRETASSGEQDSEPTVFLPLFGMHAHRTGEEYTGTAPESRQFAIAVRGGTRPEESVGFSAAPLDSSTHQACLERLAKTLVQ